MFVTFPTEQPLRVAWILDLGGRDLCMKSRGSSSAFSAWRLSLKVCYAIGVLCAFKARLSLKVSYAIYRFLSFCFHSSVYFHECGDFQNHEPLGVQKHSVGDGAVKRIDAMVTDGLVPA